MIAGLASLSDETRFARFFFVKRRFSREELEHLTHCDGVNHVALVVENLNDEGRPLIAVGRWIRDSGKPEVANVAYVTTERWRGQGIGTLLIQQLAREALSRGIEKFRAEILDGNRTAIKLLDGVATRESVAPIGSGASEYLYRIGSAV